MVPSPVSLSQDYMADSAVVFSDARARCPVFHEEAIGVCVVMRYDDARIAMSDWETFSSRVLRAVPPPPDRFGDALPADRVPEQEVTFELNRVIRCHRALAVEW